MHILFRKSIASRGGIYEAGALIKTHSWFSNVGGVMRGGAEERVEKALGKESPIPPLFISLGCDARF